MLLVNYVAMRFAIANWYAKPGNLLCQLSDRMRAVLAGLLVVHVGVMRLGLAAATGLDEWRPSWHALSLPIFISLGLLALWYFSHFFFGKYLGIGSYDELVSGFTETLMTRRVSEPIRQLMSELVHEVIRAWREEFCRAISVKFNAGFLLPFCEALPNYMRKEVAKHARAMGVDSTTSPSGGGEGATEEGAGLPAIVSGLDARTSRLRASIDERLEEREMLQRIAARMRARSAGAVALKE